MSLITVQLYYINQYGKTNISVIIKDGTGHVVRQPFPYSVSCFFFVLFFRILDRGSMFVFSNAQFQTIMSVDDSFKTGTLLDLGAGDGKVTSVIKHHFDEVYVTEQSPSMRWRLSGRGFK